MDKQKAIEEIVELLFKHSGCASCKRKPCKDCAVRSNCAEYRLATALANAGYGNIRQALTEFAEMLKDKIGNEYNLDTLDNDAIKDCCEYIDKTLKEFWAMLNNEKTYITCPYCGKTVPMDWHCEKCGKKIAYDIDENLVRSNPHKENEQ